MCLCRNPKSTHFPTWCKIRSYWAQAAKDGKKPGIGLYHETFRWVLPLFVLFKSVLLFLFVTLSWTACFQKLSIYFYSLATLLWSACLSLSVLHHSLHLRLLYHAWLCPLLLLFALVTTLDWRLSHMAHAASFKYWLAVSVLLRSLPC
jgi:hypothetical protein